MPSPYAGRNQISLDAAAGKGTEADGGSTRETERGAGYTLRVGSIGNCDHSKQACPTRGNVKSRGAAESRRACTSSKARSCCDTRREAACRRWTSGAAQACRARAYALEFSFGFQAQGKLRLGH